MFLSNFNFPFIHQKLVLPIIQQFYISLMDKVFAFFISILSQNIFFFSLFPHFPD